MESSTSAQHIFCVFLTLRCLSPLSVAAAASEFPDYQTGFRSCLANVDQYLLMADNLNGSDRWMLSQLSSKLCRSRARGAVFSTMDSGLGQAETRDEAPRLLPSAAGPEERKTAKSKAETPDSTSMPPSLRSEGNKQMTATRHTQNSSGHKKLHSVSHRNEGANAQRNVWRPW